MEKRVKCPVHLGQEQEGYSFDGCFLGCGDTGWLPEPWSDEVKGLDEEELLLNLLMRNQWLLVHTDDQVKEKLRPRDGSRWFGVFSRKLVERYLAQRKR